MNLKTWIENKKLTLDEATKLFGYSDSSMLSRVLSGQRRPSPELAVIIEKATSGAVNRLELLYPDEYEKKRATGT